MSAGGEARRPRVALAASPGGHIDLLIAVAGAVEDADRMWVLPDGARRGALAAEKERTAIVRLYGFNAARLLGNMWDSLRALRRFRPDLVVTSGAGVVVPYCLLARALGARIIYLETMARVTSASKAGRVLSRVAEVTLVQWPESLSVYPGARLCAPPLLELQGPADVNPATRSGTFIALGTHWQPFSRLMAMVELAILQGLLPRPVIAQVGEFSYPSDTVETVASVPPERVDELMRQSRVVICHGGAGIISTAIRADRRPLVLARRAALGEHVDDHQREIVGKLAQLHAVRSIECGITEDAVAWASADSAAAPSLAGGVMVDVLREVLSAPRR